MSDLLTLTEAAERLHIGKTRLWEMTAKGDLPVVRLPGGRLIRVQESDLQRFIERHIEGGNESAARKGTPAAVEARASGHRSRG